MVFGCSWDGSGDGDVTAFVATASSDTRIELLRFQVHSRLRVCGTPEKHLILQVSALP